VGTSRHTSNRTCHKCLNRLTLKGLQGFYLPSNKSLICSETLPKPRVGSSTLPHASLRFSGFCGLILTLAFFDVAPVEFGEIELIAIRVFEADERTGFALIDDVTLEMNAFGF
jgi:hypothetical protein